MPRKATKVSEIHFDRKVMPVTLFPSVLENVFNLSSNNNSPILSIVIGTKPDFYKQAPLILEASKSHIPIFVINTGQHFDKLLGFGINEFEIQEHIGCNLQIRGDLMEKASELIMKFGTFGRYCKKKYRKQYPSFTRCSWRYDSRGHCTLSLGIWRRTKSSSK